VVSLPSSYLTSYKNLKDILQSIQGAQAPKKFTVNFLLGLGYKGTADRLIIGYLKSLGFLNPSGEPTPRYYAFLDQTQGSKILAEAITEAYADLFQVNTKAHELSAGEIKNKLRTITQGQFSDAVLDKMAGSFKAISALADFSHPHKVMATISPAKPEPERVEHAIANEPSQALRLGGLVYNIQIHLPDSRDPAVYDALFRSLKDHLLK
jgi:hypothetical protein